MVSKRPTHLQRAFDRFFLTIVEGKNQPVAGWDLDQPARRVRGPEFIRAARDFVKCFQQSALLVNHEPGVTRYVHEQDMRDLQLDFFFNFASHFGSLSSFVRRE